MQREGEMKQREMQMEEEVVDSLYISILLYQFVFFSPMDMHDS